MADSGQYNAGTGYSGVGGSHTGTGHRRAQDLLPYPKPGVQDF